MLNRSHTFVVGKLKKLGLEIPREIIDQRITDSRIKKGNIPLNKGVKMSQELYQKAKPTMFKKGNLPHNTKHDGYVSKRHHKRDGRDYLFIRIEKGKFELLHRKTWMDANGEIPNGMIVAFKNGDTLDCRLENLKLISLKENMLRNSIQRYPEELRKSIHLIGVLNRHIKKQNKHEQE